MKTRPLSLSLSILRCIRVHVKQWHPRSRVLEPRGGGVGRRAGLIGGRPFMLFFCVCVRVWRRYFFRQNSSLFQENTHSKERRTVKIHKTPSLISQSAEPPPRSCCRRHGGVAHLFQLREQQTLLPYPVLIYRQIDSGLLFSLSLYLNKTQMRLVGVSLVIIKQLAQILWLPWQRP